MNPEETGSNQAEMPGSQMSDGEVLRYLASQVEDLIEAITDRLEAVGKQVDHIDGLAHAIDQKVTAITAELETYRPLLNRYTDPGAAVRGFLGIPPRKGKADG